MSLSLAETPDTVKIRCWKYHDTYCVLQRDGKGWEGISGFTKNEALEVIERHFALKDADWSLQVKMRAGYCCQHPGCGELEKSLLESHHVKPVSQYPELRNDLTNGKCLCLYHHALAHTGWIRRLIMARGFLILWGKLYPQRKAEIGRIEL